MSKIITDMVDKKYLSRILVYRKGKDELLLDSLSGDNREKAKGYKLVERRLIAREIHEDCYDNIDGLGGSAIPPSILYNKKIKHSHKMLWGRLYYLRQAKGYCWADNEWLAERSPYTRGSIANMISDMVAAGVLKRTMVYSNGEEEILEDSWSNNDKKGYLADYDLIGRRLVTIEPEDIQSDEEILKIPDGSLKNLATKLKSPTRELDLELDTSIRQKKEKENGTKEKKEKFANSKADCGYAAPHPLQPKYSTTEKPQLRSDPPLNQQEVPIAPETSCSAKPRINKRRLMDIISDGQQKVYESTGVWPDAIHVSDEVARILAEETRASIVGRNEHILEKWAENMDETLTENKQDLVSYLLEDT